MNMNIWMTATLGCCLTLTARHMTLTLVIRAPSELVNLATGRAAAERTTHQLLSTNEKAEIDEFSTVKTYKTLSRLVQLAHCITIKGHHVQTKVW